MPEQEGMGRIRECVRLRSVAAALLIALLAAGSATAESSDRTTVKAMALVTKDLPAGYRRTNAHVWTPKTLATQGTYSLEQLRKWGYVVGYEAEFDRDVNGEDPTQVSSDVGAYREKRGAQSALEKNADLCQRGLWRPIDSPAKLRDQMVMCTLAAPFRGGFARVFFVVWRIGRFKGSITLSGVQNQVAASEAKMLAERQMRRMKRVRGR